MDGGVIFFKAELIISGNSMSGFCVYPILENYFKVLADYR
jgi:hypothetical protein